MSDQNKWEEKFSKKWPSISIGYDGSEADAMKRDEIKKFISQVVQETKEQVVRDILDQFEKEDMWHSVDVRAEIEQFALSKGITINNN